MRKIAKKYIDAGFSIVPIPQGEKRPSIDWKEYQTRFATNEELDTWFRDDKMNIGIVTGRISGITVVDVDAKSGGLETLKTLGLPITWTVKTGGGGWHYYYKFNHNALQTTNIYQGIDIRNEGGQVVAPPSLHKSGNRYEWTFKEDEMAEFPIELFDNAKQKEKKDWAEIIKTGAKEGSRNQDATSLFGKLMNIYRPEEWESIVWNIALYWNSKSRPPMSEKELKSCYNHVAQRAINDGREPSEEDLDKKLTGKTANDFKEDLMKKAKEPRTFFSWGTQYLNNTFPFIQKGTYTVFFGQQGSGKTTYALHLARLNSKKHKVTFLTTEMSREQLIELYCIKRAGITDEQFKSGQCDVSKAIDDYINELDNINFVGIDDKTLFQEYAVEEVKKIIDKNQPELLIIDNLDKLKGKGKTELDISKSVSAGVMQCARTTGVAIILIHHANKAIQDKSKNPMMYAVRGLSGFRGTNKIADDADIIIEICGVSEKYRENAGNMKFNTSKICAYKDRNFNRKGSAVVEFKDGMFSDFIQFNHFNPANLSSQEIDVNKLEF